MKKQTQKILTYIAWTLWGIAVAVLLSQIIPRLF